MGTPAVLPLDGLLHVFSFLEAPDLLRAAQVDKVWNEAAECAFLWRRLSLSRWTFCNISQASKGAQTWKQYYLHRSQLEHQMALGRPSQDFTCKAISGHEGKIDGMAYLSAIEQRFDGQEKSVVCTVSADCTVRAWNVQEGTQIWSSSVQPAPLRRLLTVPEHRLVITMDGRGTIKVWDGQTGKEQATFITPSTWCNLVLCGVPENPFLTVAITEGVLYTLTVPCLKEVSQVTAFQNCHIDLLLCSPDKNWILVGSTETPDVLVKVFHTDSLTRRSEDKPLSNSLPVGECRNASWAPREAARLIVLHEDRTTRNLSVTTFDIASKQSKNKVEILAQQVASFILPESSRTPHILESHGSDVILLGCGSGLTIFSITGNLLASFQDHHQMITSIWVDNFRVVTSSQDTSLRVYTWKREKNTVVLKSCYHLLGGSHRWSSGFTDVACDNMSIVAVETRKCGKSILKAYFFNL
ncbi:F-box/WD repeat-containing protein 12-like isoform X1 [Phascolarctos cinereus]|uniref:F-box/WD repeat-containing protein 12-like isoform X1 n=1 Tax=Phascolarctos cinereus TaxID=38626 RepID=A0A6P5JS37_PHACI|nr:F-box/WD repeat-containing protein 12-like isoform X1 [Phascolarctos cinereus]